PAGPTAGRSAARRECTVPPCVRWADSGRRRGTGRTPPPLSPSCKVGAGKSSRAVQPRLLPRSRLGPTRLLRRCAPERRAQCLMGAPPAQLTRIRAEVPRFPRAQNGLPDRLQCPFETCQFRFVGSVSQSLPVTEVHELELPRHD